MSAQIIYPLLIEPDTDAVRALGYRMALKQWRDDWKKAKAEQDYAEMDRLNLRYEMLSCY